MAYETYSTEKVFSTELLNILCNKILDKVHTDFPGSETKLVAEGELARIIQGEPLTPLPVISFVTNDAAIYDYLVKNLKSIISVQTQLSFKDRIQVVTSLAYFEFWYDLTFVSSVNVSGLYCRNITEL